MNSNANIISAPRKFGILSAFGYLVITAKNQEEAEELFSKDFDIEKYPVKELFDWVRIPCNNTFTSLKKNNKKKKS